MKREASGVGAVMPVPVNTVLRSDDESEEDSQRQVKKLKKTNTTRTPTRKRLTMFQSDLSQHEMIMNTECVDILQGDAIVPTLVGTSESKVFLESLYDRDDESTTGSVEAGKVFDTPFFTSGFLHIPPNGQKLEEMVSCPEVFFIRSCSPTSGLLVKINDNEQVMNVGDQFWIPPLNKYSLVNLSKSTPVELVFFLGIDHIAVMKHHNNNNNDNKGDDE